MRQSRLIKNQLRRYFADVAQLAEQLICNQQVIGSSPIIGFHGPLAQLGEHLPYKQRVIGSSPIGPIV